MSSLFDSVGSIVNSGGNMLNKAASGEYNWGGMLGQFMDILLYGLYAALAIGIVYYIYRRFFVFKIDVDVHVIIGGGLKEIKKDIAMEKIDTDGKRKLIMYKTKVGTKPATCPIPDLKYRYKNGKRDFYHMMMDTNGQLHPIRIVKPDPDSMMHLKPMPQERNAWAMQERKLIMEKFQKKDLIMQLWPPILVMICMGCCVAIIYFISKDVAGGLNNIANQFGQVAQSCLSVRG